MPIRFRALLSAAVWFVILFSAGTAFGQEGESTLSAGDTAWVLTSSTLVLLMTLPGLALFYGGLVRSKNVLSILMQCLISAGLVGTLWVLLGYSLSFGDGNAIIGGLGKIGLAGIGTDTLWGTIPEYAFVVFQGMFAIITPALMLGAFAERMRFGAYLIFIGVWLLVVYCPLAHMVWGGGWIAESVGAMDFAGGLVVHMSSGFSALVAAIMLGKRAGYDKEPMPPHNLPLAVIGASLLWVGWFGFNAGSALAADGVAALALLNTNTATAAAVLGWVAIEWLHRGKPTVLGGATAAVAGLVAITPACATVSPIASMAVGLGAATFCYGAVTLLKPVAGYDDSLDVFGVHGIGGAWGAIATGLFISELPQGISWGSQVGKQLVAVGIVAIFAPFMTFFILSAMKLIVGDLRVSAETEYKGLDLAEHSESAYTPGGHLS